MTKPLIIFDLDGTLVDTAPDLMSSLNHVLEADGLEPVDYASINTLVGQGARSMIERAYELREATLEPERLQQHMDLLRAHYMAEMPGQSRPFPGAVAALERLKQEGFQFAVCTNKLEDMARPLLEKLELSVWFSAVAGGDTFAVKKPDARHVLGTIELAGGTREAAIMIGDSVNDIKAAANAGIPSIAVPFGYSDVPVDQLSPNAIIEHFDDLTPDLVTALLRK